MFGGVRRGPWTDLALYVAGIFLTLPVLPGVVRWSNQRLGPQVAIAPAMVALAATAAALSLRLARTRVPFPKPHLALAAMGVAAAGAWSLLASSPIGRVHLAEYGLLAVLAVRAFGPGRAATLAGGALAAAVGLLDEVVQGFIPNRVFDWWDVALNAAAAALGAAAAAWWRWTGRT